MTQQEANEIIAQKLNQACELIKECELIADEAKVDFKFDVAHGMGGYYEEGGWNPLHNLVNLRRYYD